MANAICFIKNVSADGRSVSSQSGINSVEPALDNVDMVVNILMTASGHLSGNPALHG